MNRNIRHFMLGSTSLAAAFTGIAVAHAQDVLETVIVTAEKQAADIQKTSISMTAIQPTDLNREGRMSIQDMLMSNTVGVQIRGAAQNGQTLAVRGLGTVSASTTTIQIDDVEAANLQVLGGYDVARVEILRGPQGTLYGRNAEIGALNVYTNDPTDKYEGNIFLGGGAYNQVLAQGAVNIPLDEQFALRVAFGSEQRTGYTHPTGGSNADYMSVRGKLAYKPNDDFNLQLSGTFGTSFNTGSLDTISATTKIANFASPSFGGFNPCGGNPKIHPGDPFHGVPDYGGTFSCTVPAQLPVNPNPVTGVCQRVARAEETESRVGAQMDWDLGFGNLFAVVNASSSRQPLGSHAQGATGNSNNNLWTNSDSQVAEVRITNPKDTSWKWVGGLYWNRGLSEGHNWNRNTVTGSAAPIGNDAVTLATTGIYSAFGQVTVPVTEGFRVVGGLRWATDWRESTGYTQNVKTRTIIAPGKLPGSVKWPSTTYKAGFEVDVADESLLYANIATGFRQGSTTTDQFCKSNTTNAAVTPIAVGSGGGCPAGSTVTSLISTSDPDKIKHYEVGSKNRFLDNRLQFNVAGYYYTLTNFSVTALGVNHANLTGSLFNQVKGAKAWGIETETSWLLTPNDRFDASVAYEHTEIGDPNSPFAFPVCYNWGTSAHSAIAIKNALTGVVNTTALAACSAKNLAANPATVNWVRYNDGLKATDPLPSAPRWNGNVAYTHIFDLQSGATVSAKMNVHFESSSVTNIVPFYDTFNPAFHTVDASITYDTADGKWSLGAWVRNIENTAYVTGSNNGGGGTNWVYTYLGAPRAWGITLNAKF